MVLLIKNENRCDRCGGLRVEDGLPKEWGCRRFVCLICGVDNIRLNNKESFEDFDNDEYWSELAKQATEELEEYYAENQRRNGTEAVLEAKEVSGYLNGLKEAENGNGSDKWTIPEKSNGAVQLYFNFTEVC